MARVYAEEHRPGYWGKVECVRCGELAWQSPPYLTAAAAQHDADAYLSLLRAGVTPVERWETGGECRSEPWWDRLHHWHAAFASHMPGGGRMDLGAWWGGAQCDRCGLRANWEGPFVDRDEAERHAVEALAALLEALRGANVERIHVQPDTNRPNGPGGGGPC
jgi:hypothetical protein